MVVMVAETQVVTTIAGVIPMKIVVVQTVVEIQNALIIQVVTIIWYAIHTKTVPVGIVQWILRDAQGIVVYVEIHNILV